MKNKGWLIVSIVSGIISLAAPIISAIADSKVQEVEEQMLEERITNNILNKMNEEGI